MRSIKKVKNKNDKSKETTIKERKARIPYQTDLTNNFYTKSIQMIESKMAQLRLHVGISPWQVRRLVAMSRWKDSTTRWR